MKAAAASLIIPTCRRPEALRACLASLPAREEGGVLEEIIVVDDGSSNATAAICAADPRVRYAAQPNRGAASARNHGARLARADWLIFLDDDCTPSPGWLPCLLHACGGGEMVMAGGRMINALPGNPFSEASQVLLDHVYRHYNQNAHQARFVASSNLALSRRRFLAMGGFDEHYPQAGAEDRDFCARWLADGGRIKWVAEAAVHHAHAMDWRGFCRQHYRYGRGARRFHAEAASDAERGMQAPGYYWRMLFHPLRSPSGVAGLRLAALMVLSQIMSTLGYWRGASLKGPPA